MDGVWYKLCPQCRNYIKKAEPQDSGKCRACGWEEYSGMYFCEIADKYCMFYPPDLKDKLAA
jgi:hypothetical protein